MIGIAYLVEGSGALNNEMLRVGWVESRPPHVVAVIARGRRITPWTEKQRLILTLHIRICKSTASFQVRMSRYVDF